MVEFKKNDNFVKVKIGNIEYKIEPVIGTRMIHKYNDEAVPLLEEIERSKYSEATVKKYMEFVVEILDEVLGDKACENIFGGLVRYYDLLDLYVCIRDAVMEFNKDKTKNYAI